MDVGPPDSEPGGPARGEHPQPPDRDEDEPAEESLAHGGQLQVHVVAEADQQLGEHRHHAHPHLAQGQLVHGVLAQPGRNLTQIPCGCGQLFMFSSSLNLFWRMSVAGSLEGTPSPTSPLVLSSS